jgi:predicted alpha/beta-fold hydrolase
MFFLSRFLIEILTCPFKTINEKYGFDCHRIFKGPLLQAIYSTYKFSRIKIDYIKKQHINNKTLYWIKKEPNAQLTLFILPGLGGSWDEIYIKSWLSIIHDKNYNMVVMLRRGNESNVDPANLPSHADINDIDECINRVIVETSERIPIYGIGYSAGGNHISKYACIIGNNKLNGIVNISTCNDVEKMISHLRANKDVDKYLAEITKKSIAYESRCL